jgi:insulysin
MKKLINIPDNDLRKYGYGILENNVKYVLVNDDKIDVSSVCVAVKTGSVNDPIKYQGLAHFLEHMLFLGSKKYPQENYFDSELKANGGYSNAWTDNFETVYYFSVQNGKLGKLIDVFSRFFIDPLFDEGSVNREINAVDSEHKKNIESDIWRTFHLIKKISKISSQINKFGTGNLETLNKKGLRDRMREFYNDYYCSENISISIISSEKLSKLEKYVKKSFGNIKCRKAKEIIYKKPFYSKNKKCYHLVSNGKVNQMLYLFEIPLFTDDLEYKTWTVIEELFYDQGKNSLRVFLKKKGLINNLYINNDDMGIFLVIFDLQNNKEKTKELIDSYFRYFLKELKNLKWENISKYVKKNKNLIFNYGSRPDALNLIQNLAINGLYYNLEDVVSADLIKKIDKNRIEKYLKKFLNIKISNQIQISNKKRKDVKYEKEKYYKFNYGEIKRIRSNSEEFDLKFNTINEFDGMKPKNIKIKSKYNIPQEIYKNVWFGNTSNFNEPLIYSALIYSCPKYIKNPHDYLKNIITVHCINHYLSMNFNQEMNINFDTSISILVSNGLLVLSINGPNDKYDIFYNNVLSFIKNLKLESYVIKLLKKKIKQNLVNIKKLNPWEYMSEKVNEKFNPYEYSDSVLLENIDNINVSEIKKNMSDFLNIPVRKLIYGNILEDNLKKLNNISDEGNSKIPGKFKFNTIKSFKIKHPNKKEKNNCIQILYPIFKYSELNALLVFALKLVADQPFFNKLRTQEQLGYLVRFGKIKVRDTYYISEKIQSDKDLNYIKEKIDIFNKEFNETLLNMDTNTWTNWKKTIKKELKKRDESTYQSFSKFYTEIISDDYKFNRNDLILGKLNELKLVDLQNLFKNKIYKSKNKMILQIEGN